MFIMEDGIVEHEDNADCAVCANWGCEVCV